MDALTAERYPHGVPWSEQPSRLTAEQLRRRAELVAAMRRQGHKWMGESEWA